MNAESPDRSPPSAGDEEATSAPGTDVEPDARPGLVGSKPTVFVYDEPVRCELFELWLADGTRVVTASSPAAADRAFDDRVAVSMIRNEIEDETKERLAGLITERSPYCRTVVTTDRRTEVVFPGIEYDVCLVEPTTKAGVRETVERLIRRTVYQASLKRYYELTAFVTSREVGGEVDRDAPDAEYERARRRMTALKKRLTALQRTFDRDDLDAVLQSLHPDRTFDPEADDETVTGGEKHRPETCVNCGLDWTAGDAENRYERLGAFVWKCRECGTVQNLPDPSHRRLARL